MKTLSAKFDFKEFRDYTNKWKLVKKSLRSWCMEACNELAVNLYDALIPNTPVETGTLRNGWRYRVYRKNGSFQIRIENKVFYASWVEYGHRQHPGQYVPPIRKHLVKDWVDGVYMMTLTVNEVMSKGASILEESIVNHMMGIVG